MATPSTPSSAVSPEFSHKVLYETLGVIVLTVLLALLTPLRGIAVFLPLIYFLVEARLRRRTWAELGFKPHEFLQAVRMNWLWILLVGVVIQIVVILAAQQVLPAYLEHVRSRVPVLDTLQLIPVIGLLLVSTLLEEITFRALFQERLSWFVGMPTAILAAALIFGLLHLADGTPLIVTVDVGLVILDGILYGIIFARGKNIFAAWLAHFLADVTAILFLLYWVH